jgi:exodeoxyribonuclease VII small subunit
MGFEAAMKRLEEIVQRLERGEESLEDSLKLYEQGTKLKAICDRKLADARVRIEKMRLGPDGEAAGSEPLDEPDRP